MCGFPTVFDDEAKVNEALPQGVNETDFCELVLMRLKVAIHDANNAHDDFIQPLNHALFGTLSHYVYLDQPRKLYHFFRAINKVIDQHMIHGKLSTEKVMTLGKRNLDQLLLIMAGTPAERFEVYQEQCSRLALAIDTQETRDEQASSKQ
jgi:hypothetical protein